MAILITGKKCCMSDPLISRTFGVFSSQKVSLVSSTKSLNLWSVHPCLMTCSVCRLRERCTLPHAKSLTAASLIIFLLHDILVPSAILPKALMDWKRAAGKCLIDRSSHFRQIFLEERYLRFDDQGDQRPAVRSERLARQFSLLCHVSSLKYASYIFHSSSPPLTSSFALRRKSREVLMTELRNG